MSSNLNREKENGRRNETFLNRHLFINSISLCLNRAVENVRIVICKLLAVRFVGGTAKAGQGLVRENGVSFEQQRFSWYLRCSILEELVAAPCFAFSILQ